MTISQDSTFIKFLQSRKAERGQPCTMTGMDKKMPGRWMITDSDYPMFFDELHNYLFTKQLRPIGLVETRRPDKVAPLLVDLDFKYPSTSNLHRKFNETHIVKFVQELASTLNKFYNLTSYEPRFFVSLRPKPYTPRNGDQVVKDGIHIICPDIVLPAECQLAIRTYMLRNNVIEESFAGTGYINSEKDIYDDSIASGRNGWFFYGESKPDIDPYLIYKVYNMNPEDETISEDTTEYTERELLEMFSIRHNLCEPIENFRKEMKREWEELKKPLAPTKMAATPEPIRGGGAGGPDIDDADAETVVETVVDTVSERIPAWLRVKPDPLQIEQAKRIALECLSAERMNNYDSWLKVGWCLRNIDSSPEMFKVYMDCSAKSPKAKFNNIAELRSKWDNNWGRTEEQKIMLTLHSLHAWALEDNPEQHKKIVDDDIINEIMFSPITETHTAKLLHKIYKGRYVSCLDVGRQAAWFEFKNHVWKEIAKAVPLRIAIHETFANLVNQASQRFKLNIQFIDDNGKDLKNNDQLRRYKEILDWNMQLNKTKPKDNIMRECEYIFHQERFWLNLNKNPYLVGCANGIIDLRGSDPENPRVEFRRGYADDCVSFQAGVVDEHPAIEYKPWNPEDPINEELDDFFAKVFPRPDLRKYVWRLLASCLEGQNKEQRFYFWLGMGGNGKSKLQTLMQLTLGEYADDLMAQALTRRRADADKPNPELKRLIGKRFIALQEPDPDEPLNTSVMKQMSGEDHLIIRGLHEAPISIKIAGKMHLMANKLPPIHQFDDGVARRILDSVIPFESRFVDPSNPDLNPAKHVYPRDYELDKKLIRWRNVFFSRLVHIYQTEYLKFGLGTIPAIVSAKGREYLEAFNSYAKFRNDCIRKTAATIGHETSLIEIQRAYSIWQRESGTRKLAPQDLKNSLENDFDKADIKGAKIIWKHIRVFMSPEEAIAFDNECEESKL
jgi:P4 family phage/plasmid primase-like protien